MSGHRRHHVLIGVLAALGVVLATVGPAALRTAVAQDEGARPAPSQGTRQGKGKGKANASRKARRPATEKPATASRAATKSGVSFRQDVAPVLVANCVDCHTPGRPGADKGKLALTSFAKLMEGTPTRKVIVPGKPEESHLVLRVNGEEEPSMPQGGNNGGLSAEAIGAFTQWVKAGAWLDAGLDANAAIGSYAASPDEVRRNAIARKSPEERQKLIESAGRERWKQTNPALTPEITTGQSFALFHNLPRDRAASLVKSMDGQLNQLGRMLGNPASDPVEKMSLYVFNDARDFIEFVRTIENREPDAGMATTARLSVPVPYIAAVDPAGGKKEASPAIPQRKARGKRAEEKESPGASDRTLAGLVTERLGEEVVLSRGRSPRWLAYGLGSYLASRTEPRSMHYRELRGVAVALARRSWESTATAALGADEQLTPQETRAVGFAIVEALIQSPDLRSGFSTFCQEMSKGPETLDEALTKVYRANREQFLAQTGAWVDTQYGRAP